MDKVIHAANQKDWKFEVISINLSKEQEDRLRMYFGVL
jgi:uncharacterized membrane protein